MSAAIKLGIILTAMLVPFQAMCDGIQTGPRDRKKELICEAKAEAIRATCEDDGKTNTTDCKKLANKKLTECILGGGMN